MALQNLINQLMQPTLGEDKPSTIKRRAAEALVRLSNQSQADQAARITAEADARQSLELLELERSKLQPSNHQEIYNEVMNRDYFASCT